MWITEGLTDGKDLQRKVSEKRKMSMLVIFGVLVMFTGDAMGSLSMIPDCSFTQSDPCYGAVGHPLHLQLPFEYELNLRKNDSATHTLSRIFKVKHHRITKMPSDDQRWQFVSKNRTIIISSAEKRDSGKYFLDTFDFSGTSKGMYDLQLVIEENSPPTINLLEFGQSIMCVIEDFYPKPLSIKWKKDDREVRGRDWKTTENDSGSYRAVSVLEANLTSSSPGNKYTCEVTHGGRTYEKNLSPAAQFSLKINPPPAKELFINQRAVLECVLTGDNQKEVEGATVSWTVGGRSPATRDVRVGGVTQAGSAFTKTSTLTLEESVWFSGDEVICSTSVDQRTTSDKISVKRGGQRPSIVIYKPDKTVSDSDSVSLVCEVSSSDLANVYVMWKVNGGQYIEGNSMTTIKNDNTLIVLSYLTVTGQQYNSAEITCAVKDANIQNDLQPRTSSPSKTNSPPTIRLVEFGQSIMCIIEDFYPKSLRIKWKKDDREVRGRDWKTTENDSGSYRAVSVLEANLGSSSPGTKYTCEVTHRGKKYSDNLSSRVQSSLKINPPPAKELFINQRAVLECVLTGDSRKEVEGATVSWTAGGRSPATRDVRVGGVTQAGSAFTKTSTLTLEESVWFSGAEVICSTSRTSERISVKRGGQRPSIVIYKPHKSVLVTDMVSLVCEVSSSDLTNVYVMWQVNGGQYIEGHSMTSIKKDNTLTVLSYLTVPGQQYNRSEFACAVKHANMENSYTLTTRTTSMCKANCQAPAIMNIKIRV
uniref:Ig-like domain-containing protein n=1 Tax=Pygocentrus nattereri TaxID=42514 RepID=A0AAR2LBH0_PYGNA